MAEETVRYKLQIDESDISQQLNSIRQQIDSTVTDAFSTSALSMSNNQILSNTISNISTGFNQFASDFSQKMGAMQFGQIPSASLSTMGGQFAASMGFGYNQQMPFFMNDYQNIGAKEFGQKLGEGVRDWGLTAASMGALAIPGIGPAVSLGLMGADMAIGAYTGVLRERDQMGEGLGILARGNNINLSNVDAKNLATDISQFAHSYRGNSLGYSMDEINSSIMGFAAAGGFSTTQSAEQFQTKSMELIENTRLVMKSLQMFQEQAVSLMAQMETKGIGTVGQMPSIISSATTLAGMAGINTGSMIEYGMGSVNQLQGSFLGAHASFDMGMQNRVLAGRMAVSPDAFAQESIRELGGVDAATGYMNQQFGNFVQSGYGKTMAMALKAGWTADQDYSSMITAAGSYISNNPAGAIFSIPKISDVEQTSAAVAMVDFARREVLGRTGGDTTNPEQIIASLAQSKQMSIAEASMWYSRAVTPIPETESLDKANLISTLAKNEQTTLIDRIGAGLTEIGKTIFGSGFSDTAESINTLGKNISKGVAKAWNAVSDVVTGTERVTYTDMLNTVVNDDLKRGGLDYEKYYAKKQASGNVDLKGDAMKEITKIRNVLNSAGVDIDTLDLGHGLKFSEWQEKVLDKDETTLSVPDLIKAVKKTNSAWGTLLEDAGINAEAINMQEESSLYTSYKKSAADILKYYYNDADGKIYLDSKHTKEISSAQYGSVTAMISGIAKQTSSGKDWTMPTLSDKAKANIDKEIQKELDDLEKDINKSGATYSQKTVARARQEQLMKEIYSTSDSRTRAEIEKSGVIPSGRNDAVTLLGDIRNLLSIIAKK